MTRVSSRRRSLRVLVAGQTVNGLGTMVASVALPLVDLTDLNVTIIEVSALLPCVDSGRASSLGSLARCLTANASIPGIIMPRICVRRPRSEASRLNSSQRFALRGAAGRRGQR